MGSTSILPEKASHTKVNAKQLEQVLPTLADRMGTVKLRDWYKFERNVKSRIRRAMPRRNFRRPFSFIEFAKWRERVHLVALSVAVQVKEELFQSKEWTFEDGVKISEWLDGYDWGVKKLRDNDPQWKALYESIGHYLKDEKLRELIERHIDFSYIYNNQSLIVHYSHKFKDNVFSLMLHETLIGSPISPEKAEMALSEVLEQIEYRLGEIGTGESGIIISNIRVVDVYEDNRGECGLIFRNTSLANLTHCQAMLIDLAFEALHPHLSLERYPRAEHLVCTEDVAALGDGKVPLFRWGKGTVGKSLEIVYQKGTESIGYGVANTPILMLLNLWAEGTKTTYAVCKLEDRLGWGYSLSILETGILLGNVSLTTFQKPNPDIEVTDPQ